MWKKWRPVSERSTFWNCDLPRKTAWFIGILQKLGRYNPKKTQPTSGLFSWSLKWCQVMTSSETKHRLKLTDARQNGSMQNSSAIHMIFFWRKPQRLPSPKRTSSEYHGKIGQIHLKKKKFHLPSIKFQGRTVTFREGINCFGGKPPGIKKPTWTIIPLSK